MVRRQLGGPAQPGFRIAEVLFVPGIGQGEVAHGIDLVGVRLQDGAQVGNGLFYPACPQVFHAGRDPARVRVPVEEFLELFVGFRSAAHGSERLTQFPVCKRQPRFAFDRLPEQRDGFIEPPAHGENAAQILVDLGETGLQGQRPLQLAFRLREPVLFHQGMSEQAQVIDAAGIHEQVVPADLLGPQRPVGFQGLHRAGDADLRFRAVRAHADCPPIAAGRQASPDSSSRSGGT